MEKNPTNLHFFTLLPTLDEAMSQVNTLRRQKVIFFNKVKDLEREVKTAFSDLI